MPSEQDADDIDCGDMSIDDLEEANEITAAQLHGFGRSLIEGDQVLFNDRSRALCVVDRHTRPNKKAHRSGPYYVFELEGNGTEYHLLCWERASYGPMLYKESDWEKTEDRYEYPRGGERITSIKVVGGESRSISTEGERAGGSE